VLNRHKTYDKEKVEKKKEKFTLFLITDNAGINRFCLGVAMFTVFKPELPPLRHGATFYDEL